MASAQRDAGQPADTTWSQLLALPELAQLTTRQKRELWDEVFRCWDTLTSGPAPMWLPDSATLESANLTAFFRETCQENLASLTQWWQHSPDKFWSAVIKRLQIRFDQPPSSILSGDDLRQPEWLQGSSLNIAESCFQADGEAIAIRSGTVDGCLQDMTYRQLREAVENFASNLHSLGFQPGERIAIVMPMTADAVIAYLGILWGGYAVVSIADSFAVPEMARRLQISAAVGVVCCHKFTRAGKTIDIYSRIVAASGPRAIVLTTRQEDNVALRPEDLLGDDFLRPGMKGLQGEPHYAGPDHTINILFSSGTTGDPKAIPWDQTTPIKCAADGMFHQDIHPEDVVVWPTNLGWMMGPWLIFATLINRATIGLFEDAPVGEAFGRFVQDAQTTILGVVPTLVRAWRKSCCMESFDWSTLRCFSSTGETSNADDMFYLSSLAHFRPVIEYCGGTEIGGGYVSSTVLQANLPATFSTLAVGNHCEILDSNHQLADEGELFLIPPTIGLSRQLLNQDHNATYYNVPCSPTGNLLRRHGDYFRRHPNGYFAAGGRVDDTMNLGGMKVSSAEIEKIINQQEDILESAAVSEPQENPGPDHLIVFVVCEDKKDGKQRDPEQLFQQINHSLRTQLNPLIKIAAVHIIKNLPRTASNKIIRRKLREWVSCKE